METLTIGRLARGAGVGVQTIRYYERRGLVSPRSRRDSGYREYVAEDVRRIRFIKNAQHLGFTLQEIQDLLDLRVDRGVPCDDVRRRAEAKIAEVAQRVRARQKMKRTLSDLVKSCETRSRTGACPILDALEETA